jgi:hypothetical protein
MFRNYLVNFILNYVCFFLFFLSLLVSLSVFEVYITSIAYFASDHCIFVTVIGGLEPKLDNVIRTSRLSWMHKALSHSLWSIESLFIVVLQCQLISFWSHTCGDSSNMIWTDYWRLLAFLKCPNDRVKSNYCIK